MMKAIAKKPSPDYHNKRKQDATNDAPKNSHAIFSHPQTPIIQLKPICPCDGGCPRCAGIIQPKIRIGQPNDIYEQEADKVAEQVMRMPEPGCPECPEKEEEEELIQAKPISPKITPLIQRQVEEEEEEVLQTRDVTGETSEVTSNVEARINTLKGGGQPLPKTVRSFMGSRFGADFSGVRIHADSNATQLNRELHLPMEKIFILGQGDIIQVHHQAKDFWHMS